MRLNYDFENECPSTLAKEVSERYVEVMVDEYQDVNAVQELIFSSVSRCQMNMFMVGDVKQSIYRFRMADPTIFLGKYQFFDDYEENFDGPQKVLLPENFRSRPEILNAVNYIFKNLMSSRFGEIDYTEKEYLRSGAEFEKAEENPVEYDILEVCDEDADDLVYAEAEYVAQKIRDMVNSEMKVPDKEGFRKVTFSDFAILLRSMKGRAWKYAVALNKFGVQADIPVADDFFETYEVSTVMSLLAVIDNPHQDIPLISVLRSPVFGFSLDELAEIRAANRKSDIFDAVSAKKDELVKCKKFIDELEYLREVSSEMSSDKFIWMLYSRTGILEMFSAAPDGEDRKENLVLLAELARKFEANGFKGLFRFVNQLKAMMEKGSQVAGSDGTGGSGVRIMSIHKSKGLEFPVVILADTTHRFNLQDTTKPVLFHAKLGLGLYRRVKEKRYKYPTLSRRAVSRRITLETMSEELRVLYVALTRAKHKLVMVSTVKDADKEFEKYWPSGEYPAPPTALENIKSYAGWLMTTMLTRPESASVYTPAEVRYAMPDDDAWCVRRVQYSPVEEHEDHQTAERAVEADADIKEHIKRNLEFKYPYSESSDIPSKLTATQLKGRSLDSEVSDGAPVYADRKFSIRKPDFARAEKPLTGSEKGTALHYVMQYIDYTKCLNTEDVKSELFRLVDKKFITQKQADAVKPESICRFFESSLGKSLLASDKIFREFKFSVLVSANEVMDTEADDKVLFQGVVDCFFEDQDGITVIDFKTDRITDFNYESKINTYSTQIKSYSKALERITEKKVKSSVLYFFDMNKAIEII